MKTRKAVYNIYIYTRHMTSLMLTRCWATALAGGIYIFKSLQLPWLGVFKYKFSVTALSGGMIELDLSTSKDSEGCCSNLCI